MRIIDLLTIGAENGKLPKRFMYDGYMYTLNDIGMYVDNEGDYITSHICHDLSNLNDEIEIIEEDKDIEKLNAEIIAKRNYCDALSLDFLKLDLKSMCEKINELIDEINKLKEDK